MDVYLLLLSQTDHGRSLPPDSLFPYNTGVYLGLGIAKIRLNLEPGNSNPVVAGTGKSRFQSNPEKMGSSVENRSQDVTSHQRYANFLA